MSQAVRVMDSSTIFKMSAGSYIWFQNYDQTCIKSGANDCQWNIFHVEDTYDLWVYTSDTIGNIEMISPLNRVPVMAANNRSRYASHRPFSSGSAEPNRLSATVTSRKFTRSASRTDYVMNSEVIDSLELFEAVYSKGRALRQLRYRPHRPTRPQQSPVAVMKALPSQTVSHQLLLFLVTAI